MIEKIKINSDILSNFIKLNLSSIAWKVLWYIIYQISLNKKEFEMRFIIKHTCSNRASVNRAIKELIDKKIIIHTKEDKKNIYILNNNLLEWELSKVNLELSEPIELEIKKTKVKIELKTEEASKEFFIFYNNYPWRIRYKQTMEAWIKINPLPELAQVIIDAVNKFKTSDEWKKDNGKYIPAPDNFLINERWRDELHYKQDWRET